MNNTLQQGCPTFSWRMLTTSLALYAVFLILCSFEPGIPPEYWRDLFAGNHRNLFMAFSCLYFAGVGLLSISLPWFGASRPNGIRCLLAIPGFVAFGSGAFCIFFYMIDFIAKERF